MPTNILDEFDKMTDIESGMMLEDAISIIDKFEKYIPIFFSRNSYGNRISQIYNFEKENASNLVNISIADCEHAISQYSDYAEGMAEIIESTSGSDVDPYDMGVVYDKDVVFINECFDDSTRIDDANVGQALVQLEVLINAVPELEKIKNTLISYRDGRANPKFVSIYCHSVCSFYKRLIKEILRTFISLDDAERNPKKYYPNKKVINTSKVSTGRRAR